MEFVHNPNAYMPFSLGPANCAETNLVLLGMRAVICSLVQRLDMRLDEGWDPLEWERSIEDITIDVP